MGPFNYVLYHKDTFYILLYWNFIRRTNSVSGFNFYIKGRKE